MTLLLTQGSASHLPLADESVQCVVTSPPYWGLRQYAGEQREVWGGESQQHVHEWSTYPRQDERYTGKRKWQHIGVEAQSQGVKVRDVDPNAWGHPQIENEAWCACGAWYGALGLEPTPELYVEHMVEIFREVRRALRRDGTLWLNLGDSYASQGVSGLGIKGASSTLVGSANSARLAQRKQIPDGLKPKDLVGIPWMVAFALRADGWYLRSDIIWHKPNPMPESVTDRPTKSHEYLFLLTKNERYFYDAQAIAETSLNAGLRKHTNGNDGMDKGYDGNRTRDGFRRGVTVGATRNRRTVWTIATRPYPGAHFATFPEQLVEPCILAGTSPKACGVCGAPWERVTERTTPSKAAADVPDAPPKT